MICKRGNGEPLPQPKNRLLENLVIAFCMTLLWNDNVFKLWI